MVLFKRATPILPHAVDKVFLVLDLFGIEVVIVSHIELLWFIEL
jgi:hypothetical protein